MWAVADDFTLFVIARAVGGVSKANVSLATAIMADITDSATRTKAMVPSASIKKISSSILMLNFDVSQFYWFITFDRPWWVLPLPLVS